MYQKILIAVAPETPDFAADMLGVAKRLARDGAEIVAMRVTELAPVYVVPEMPTGMIDTARQEVEDTLRAAVGDPSVGLRVETGHPAGKILEEAGKGYDLILVRSHQPGLPDYFFGSTAGRVVRHAPCSVHVIR